MAWNKKINACIKSVAVFSFIFFLAACGGDNGNSSSDSGTDTPEGFVRENISVTGVAQKGPFKFGSPLNLYELKRDLTLSGTVYKDEISSNMGDFVIPKVSLTFPYAKLEVRGLYRNEVSGAWSSDSMTLRALTDFSEDRTEVNINLLTHLEYDRALYLVQDKGYSVYAAKKQAVQEIMTAFEFATAVTYSEDFAIFLNEGVSANNSAGNATLLAISVLIMGNHSDAEIQNVIDNFIADFKTDGEWNDLQTKADMADWAYDFDYSILRASVKSWNVLDIPDYETYLDIYWNNVYGLGGCSENRKDVVAPDSNKLSKNYNKYFICNGSLWEPATTLQKDTYEWASGKNGEFKKGNVTDSVYVYDGSKWEFSEMGNEVGVCDTTNAGDVIKFDRVYYVCRDGVWSEENDPDFYFTDLRDGQVYRKVTIGEQIWMAENLNYETEESLCYNDADSNCTKYGRLYSWPAAMDSAGTWSTNGMGCGYRECSPTYPVRGVCPEGWHLPSKTEFEALITAVGGKDGAGTALKSTSGWYYDGNGTDDFGFSALPAGYRQGEYDYEGRQTYFWSSNRGYRGYPYTMDLYHSSAKAYVYDHDNYYRFSVRCLKDEN